MWLAAAMADSTTLKHGVQDRVSSSLGISDEKGHEKEEKGEKNKIIFYFTFKETIYCLRKKSQRAS